MKVLSYTMDFMGRSLKKKKEKKKNSYHIWKDMETFFINSDRGHQSISKSNSQILLTEYLFFSYF